MKATRAANDRTWTCLFIAWLLAACSVAGALFFSEVMRLPPCSLCWYQRIFMVPLVIVLPLAMFPLDAKVVRYALPLALIGWVISAFHVLLAAGVIPEAAAPCSQGIPCDQQPIIWAGFVTIPLLSFLAFSMINALLIAARTGASK